MKADSKIIPALTKRIEASQSLDTDLLLCAHLTAALVAPAGSFVTVSPVTREIRVCVGKERITMKDIVWEDWPAWRLRWIAGALDSVFGLVERTIPGVDFLYGRGTLSKTEPPYGCRLMVGSEVLGEGQHIDGASAVALALLDTLSPRKAYAAAMRQPAHGSA